MLITALASYSELFGQDKFLPGYIVTNENDTIYGQVLNGIDSELAFGISFTDTIPNSKITKYQVSELTGFGFSNGRRFDRVNIINENDSLSSVFAKKVLTGEIDMWVWRKSGRNPDIFLRNNGNGRVAHLFKGEDTIISENGKDYKKKNVEYIGRFHKIHPRLPDYASHDR